MRNYLKVLALLLVVFACNSNKKQDNGVRPQGSDSLFNAYKTMKLPFNMNDSTMKSKASEQAVNYELFTRFIPDTIFNTPFGQDRKLVIHPIGKIEQKNKETYFVSYVESKDKSAAYVSVIDKGSFSVSMPLVINDGSTDKKGVSYSASIDKKLTIVTNKEWTVKNDIYYYRVIYAYNNVGAFTTVLTETNEMRAIASGVNNPLDTFPRKYRYSGDYAKGEKNLLFLRDGTAPNEYRFFVHFSKDDEKEVCGGELRGELIMTSENAGAFSASGDPCVLNFMFSNNKVQVKEKGTCGNYRGIKCFFNDTYTRRETPRAKHDNQ